jgi:predicted enzyme related to lactoylglutathione lyase
VFGWRAERLGATTLWRLEGYDGGVPGQPVPRDVLGIMVPGAQDPGAWVVDFRVQSADATVDAAVGLGAAVLQPPHDEGPFRTADLADPQGAVFSVTAFQ